MKTNNNIIRELLFGLLLLWGMGARGDVLLSVNFEDGSYDPRMSMTNAGSFISLPGIQNCTAFGGVRAFGFGISTYSKPAGWDFSSALVISFKEPKYVDTIAFKDIELVGDYGSEGQLLADGRKVGDFGRLNNSRATDTSYRTNLFVINAVITNLTFQVYDITEESEIFIDDILVLGVDSMHIVEQPKNQQIPLEGTAVFSVLVTNAIANYTFQYQWYFNDSLIAGANQSHLMLTNANSSYIGSYKVAISDGYQTNMSESAQLAVYPFAMEVYPAVEIEFPTQLGRNYQVLVSTNLIDWSNQGDPIPGTGQFIQRLYSSRGHTRTYYHVQEK